MQLFDAHNHIQDERIFPMLEKVMERARLAGVAKMAIKGCCEDDWSRVEEIANRYSDAYLAFGLHPWFIGGRSSQCFQRLEELLTSYPQASVGEIGIDHAIENRDDADQERVFLAQLEIARKYDRPVSIHCRRAWGRLIELLDQFGELPRGMLIHCFGGSAEIARELVKRGAYISFSGSITRPNAKKAGSAIHAVPDDRILIETDAPDILPHGSDAELNEPANLCHVLAKAAELRGTSEEALAETTFRNAERFFRFSNHGQDAHATEERRTSFQPVIPVQGLPENYALENRLEQFHVRHGAHLPHWTREGGVYAVTFRLADSLPQSLLVSWKTDRDNIRRIALNQQRSLSDIEENRLRELHSQKIESYLDAGQGECWLRHDSIAQMVQDTLLHFDGERYELLAWCIMPNHVHVILRPLKGFELPNILHSWKSYSANQANEILGRTGTFWQTEYYDHLIRDEADFQHAARYVLENPSKAGLSNWKWCGTK